MTIKDMLNEPYRFLKVSARIIWESVTSPNSPKVIDARTAEVLERYDSHGRLVYSKDLGENPMGFVRYTERFNKRWND